MEKFLKKNYKIIVGIILGFMLIVSLLNAWNDSAIFDETAHIGAAYTYVTQQEIRLNPEHPPLVKDLAGLSLLFLNLNFDVNQPFWTGELPKKWDEGQWAAGRSLLYQSGNNPDLILFFARLPIVILSLILGLFIFRWVRELAGTTAGLFALALYAFDPNVLGHNHYVTTDLAIAAFFAFAFYYYLKFIKNPSWKNVAVAGIFLGLLQLTKFSFLVGLPVLGFVTLVYPIIMVSRDSRENIWKFKLKKIGEYIGKGALVFMVSLIVVWGLYFANTFNMTKDTVSQSIDFNFPPNQTENIKNVYTNETLHWFNEHQLTRPLAIYGEGIAYVFRRVAGGNGAYFFGQVSGKAFLAYFPTVFLIKEPFPTLIFILLALIFAIYKLFRFFPRQFRGLLADVSKYLRTNIAAFSMFLFVALYAYVSITGNLNIGFRHLFPIFPFIYVLTAKTIFEFIKKTKNKHTQATLHIILSSLIFVLVAETIYAYPNYMSYFNQSVGGPKSGYRYVTDSNADWGQDLKRLKNWVYGYNKKCTQPGYANDKGSACYQIVNPLIYDPAKDKFNPIDKIRVDYFGGGDIETYIGDKYSMWWDSKRPIETGWYAISTNFMMGSIYDKTKKDSDSYRWLQNKKPVYQVGTSLLIYYITPEEINNLK